MPSTSSTPDQPPDWGSLPPNSIRWARWVTQQIVKLVQRLDILTGNSTATSSGSTTNSMTLQQQLNALRIAQGETADLVARIEAASGVAFASFDDSVGITGFTGFYSGVAASVIMSTPSGRMEIGYGGSLNSGFGYFDYSVWNGATNIIDKNTIHADYSQRVAIEGGASFAPSGWKTVVLEGLPVNTPLTFIVEPYAASNLTFFLGGSILARPSL